MTKTNVLGAPPTSEKITRISTNAYITDEITVNATKRWIPTDFRYATLICRDYTKVQYQEDVILLHDTENPSAQGPSFVLCFGRWNDGVA